MNLDEGMPAPASRSKGRRPVPWKIPAAVAGVAATGVLVTAAFAAQNGALEQAPAPAPVISQPVQPAADPHGHDQGAAEVTPESWSTLFGFLDGWASKDPKVRVAVFADTATAGLADQLADTAPHKTIVQPVEKVEPVGGSPMAVEFRLHFRGTTTGPVRVTMVADPESEQGWRVSSIEQIGA